MGHRFNGRALEAYIITGDKKITKTIIMTFAVHGYEDSYKKDGKVLVKEANKLIEYYAKNPDKLKNTRVIIIPCVNPDGTIAGKNNLRSGSKAFGRCIAKGVDMNRDFVSGKFKAKESRALKSFMDDYEPDIFLDFHGWLNESIGNSNICKLATSKLGLKYSQKGVYAVKSGYLYAYAYKQYGAASALIEFKSPSSVSHKKVYTFTNAVISKYNKK